MIRHIHNIARGVCVNNGSILLAWHKEQHYYFLPGGHIELRESSTAAIEREFYEEMELKVMCGGFLLLFEHAWDNGGVLQHEITSIFVVNGIQADIPLRSRVDHLEFRWVPVDEIPTLNFLPSSLREVIVDVAAGRPIPSFLSTIS